MGFRNIKIYNGGLKDWIKSRNKIDVIEALPEYQGKFMHADELLAKIKQEDSQNILDQNSKSGFTILDYRTENFLIKDKPILSIKTKCNMIKCLLDDLRNTEVRSQIPKEGLFLAGKVFLQYRKRKGSKTSPLPDFFIGAHAAVAKLQLLTRDATRYRTYFPTVSLIKPK